MNKKQLRILFTATILVSAVPIIFYIVSFNQAAPSRDPQDWNNMGGFFGGVLGPFYAVLALLVTALIAYTLKQYEHKKAYLELFQYFVSPDFRTKRAVAWKVIRRTIHNAEYADFVVQNVFLTRYTDSRLTEAKILEFKPLYKTVHASNQEFLETEMEDRHYLDAVVSFFELLASNDFPMKSDKSFDFYYDSWRPMLYWYGFLLEKGYANSEIAKKYNNPSGLIGSLRKLDNKYYTANGILKITENNINTHPVIEYILQHTDEPV